MHMITGCSFIPTVFNSKNLSFIYGGVKILQNYQKLINNNKSNNKILKIDDN